MPMALEQLEAAFYEAVVAGVYFCQNANAEEKTNQWVTWKKHDESPR